MIVYTSTFNENNVINILLLPISSLETIYTDIFGLSTPSLQIWMLLIESKRGIF